MTQVAYTFTVDAVCHLGFSRTCALSHSCLLCQVCILGRCEPLLNNGDQRRGCLMRAILHALDDMSVMYTQHLLYIPANHMAWTMLLNVSHAMQTRLTRVLAQQQQHHTRG